MLSFPVRFGQNIITCLGVCLSHPQGHSAATPGTPTRCRKSLRPIASVRRRVTTVLSGLLSDPCSFGTRVPHGVCHAGVSFLLEASCHCSFHLDSRQMSMGVLVLLVGLARWFPV